MRAGVWPGKAGWARPTSTPAHPPAPRRARREARARAASHMAAGNTAAALECYQRAVDVTPAMARQVMDTLTAAGVDVLVAPYEADAQVGLGPGS